MIDHDVQQLADEALRNLTFEFKQPSEFDWESSEGGSSSEAPNVHSIDARITNSTGFPLTRISINPELIPARTGQSVEVVPRDPDRWVAKLDLGESQDIHLMKVRANEPGDFLVVVNVDATVEIPDPKAAAIRYKLFTVGARPRTFEPSDRY